MKPITDVCRLALLGQACGDCFGAPFEYHPEAPELAKISMLEGRYLDSWEDVGLRKTKRCRRPGIYTDDTQQALVLIHAAHIGVEGEGLTTYLREMFHLMARTKVAGAHFGIHRGTGRNFRASVMTKKAVDTAGLGAAMRVGPVATLFDDPQEMVEWVLTASSVTTNNPVALASAAKFAAIAWVLAHPSRRTDIRAIDWPEDEIPSEVWRATTAALRVMKAEGEEALLTFGTMTGWANKKMRCAANGFALTGFPWAVNEALTASSFKDALVRVCRSGGDTDTVAAMAGCLAALKFGRDSIPEWMVKGLEEATALEAPANLKIIFHETTLTRLDVTYRKDLDKNAAAERERQEQKEKENPREELDLFDLAAEAFAEEDEDNSILFGQRTDPPEYRGFSNFWQAWFTLDGEKWPDTEHYYMAHKNLEDIAYQAAIRAAPTAFEAKKLGRNVQLREGWDDIKYDIMFKAVHAKLEQNPELTKVLLATGDLPIHENRPDPWWGGGPNFKGGRDWLGQILMEVRDLLRGDG